MIYFVILVKLYYMKRLYYLLLLLPFLSLAQVSTGQEQQFDYGIQNLAPQTVTTPTYLGTLGTDGTMGRCLFTNVAPSSRTININGDTQTLTANNIFRTAQADTGILTFVGLATNSSTKINIGAATGYIVDNETNPAIPTYTYVNYAGATGVTVTTVGSGLASYVMLSSAGVISFQNTFPTSADRKAKIWLGKVSHPAGSITLVVNEPDYITSPLAFSRDLFQALGPYINDGVYPYANGANLNINITAGNIHGDGINFVNSRTTPNELTMGPSTAQSFTYRTQTGAGGVTSSVTPAVYDLAGTVTAIPGSSNQATIQYFYAVPGLGYTAQLGQTLYPTYSAAVAALGKETFITYPVNIGNTVPIAALVVTKGCTALNDTGVTAQFFRANKTGEFFGASAGVSTATFQSTYNNSLVPQITTSTALGAVTIKRGSSSDTDNILVGQNGAGTNTTAITGDGNISANRFISATNTTVNPSFSADNASSGSGYFSTNSASGYAFYGSNSSSTSGISFYSENANNSKGFVSNGTASSTGNLYSGQNNGTDTFTVTKGGLLTGASLYSNGSVSATSANARGNYFTNTLVATANNDNLTALDLSPTFTNGAFTGVKNNIIKASWNTSNFSVNDFNAAGSVAMYAVASPSNTNHFLLANSGSLTLNSPTTGSLLMFRLGNSLKGQFFPTTGNFTLQNGGTFTDAGYRLDVFDNTRLNGSLTLSTAPTTSAGSYDIITRNTSTGVVEKQSSLVLITITTAVSITTATADSNSVGQNGRHVVIDNGVNAINLTCNGGVTTSYGKIGSGAITFVQGSGRTLVQLSGTAVLNGIAGSTATLWSSGTTDYLSITNY